MSLDSRSIWIGKRSLSLNSLSEFSAARGSSSVSVCCAVQMIQTLPSPAA